MGGCECSGSAWWYGDDCGTLVQAMKFFLPFFLSCNLFPQHIHYRFRCFYDMHDMFFFFRHDFFFLCTSFSFFYFSEMLCFMFYIVCCLGPFAHIRN
jgi:hypothetical protein